jgi:2-methylcitrate dehydratase
VALLDGQVLPAQFEPKRIVAPDVQALLHRVEVLPAADLTARFPSEHACRVRLHLVGGAILAVEKSDYEGFVTRPMGWEGARKKFEQLVAGRVEPRLATELAETVRTLDELETRHLTALLARADARETTKGAVR